MTGTWEPQFEHCYRAVVSRDARFDGWFTTAVTSTGIYCRPSCPARTPARANVRFLRTAAAAQAAGFRACRRCRPDAAPGSPEWDQRGDVVARAMRLIADGFVDRAGVSALARRLGCSDRHLTRLMTAELGVGPLTLARSQRARTARLLIETTTLPFPEVAAAAGFANVRQLNDTVRAVSGRTPAQLRRAGGGGAAAPCGRILLRLEYRAPLDALGTLAFLGARAVPGVEVLDDGWYWRTLRVGHGHGVVGLHLGMVDRDAGFVLCNLHLTDLRDLTAAVQRCRRLLDLDADPSAVAGVLGADPLLRPLVAAAPGRRVPGTVDGAETAVRAVLGQQISVAGARTLAGRLVAEHGEALSPALSPAPSAVTLSAVFPSAAAIADADPATLPMPAARARALHVLTGALAAGRIVLDPGSDRHEVRARLLELQGIGPWTADYIELRALGDPDAFLPGDLGVRRALAARGAAGDPAGVTALAERWRPWRAYAVAHLWAGPDVQRPPADATAQVDG